MGTRTKRKSFSLKAVAGKSIQFFSEARKCGAARMQIDLLRSSWQKDVREIITIWFIVSSRILLCQNREDSAPHGLIVHRFLGSQ